MTDAAPHATTPDGTDLLPCGHYGTDVVDDARADRVDAHERDCPFCQEAIRAAGLSGDAARDLAAVADEVAVPDTLLPGVMRTVWAELRPGTEIPLGTADAAQAGGSPTADGGATATDRAVITAVQDELDGLAGFVVHTCRIQLIPPPDAGATPGIAVRITAGGRYGTDLVILAERARTLVRSTLAEQFGLAAADVDIAIVDVFQGSDASARSEGSEESDPEPGADRA